MSTSQARLAARLCRRRGHQQVTTLPDGRRFCTNCDTHLDPPITKERR